MIRFLIAGLVLFTLTETQSAAARDACPLEEDLVIAAEDAFFPYTGLYEGELRGFSLDIVAAAYSAVGCDVSFVKTPYNRCIREVEAGRQIGCFNTTNSQENRKRFIFHEEPLFRGRIQIYAHPDHSGAFTAADFQTGRFAVVRGYTYTDEFDSNPKIYKIEVESDLQTLALVARGRADFAVVYEKVAQYQIGKNSRRIDPAPVPVFELVEFDLFISFSKHFPERSTALAQLLDEGLRTIRADGTYAAIEGNWDLWLRDGVRENRPPPHWTSATQ